MVEIIREMGTIMESMPVIFPLNILSAPMDAMSGVKSSQTSEEIEPTACELRFTVVVKFIKNVHLFSTNLNRLYSVYIVPPFWLFWY